MPHFLFLIPSRFLPICAHTIIQIHTSQWKARPRKKFSIKPPPLFFLNPPPLFFLFFLNSIHHSATSTICMGSLNILPIKPLYPQNYSDVLWKSENGDGGYHGHGAGHLEAPSRCSAQCLSACWTKTNTCERLVVIACQCPSARFPHLTVMFIHVGREVTVWVIFSKIPIRRRKRSFSWWIMLQDGRRFWLCFAHALSILSNC